MKPRKEIPAIPRTSSYKEVLEVFRAKAVPLLAVFEGTKDNMVGSISLVDFVSGEPPLPWVEALKPLCYFASSSPLEGVWHELQQRHHAFGIVVDEYGGVDGVIYSQDVATFFVAQWRLRSHFKGEIRIFKGPGETYSVEGDCPLQVLIDHVEGTWLGTILSAEGSHQSTLSSWVRLIFGRWPARGEVLVHSSGMSIEIREVLAGIIQASVFYPPRAVPTVCDERNLLTPGQTPEKNV